MTDTSPDLQMVCTDCSCTPDFQDETHEDMVKVHVTFDTDREDGFECILGPDSFAGEFMWAKPTGVENQYTIENVPFFTHDLNLKDVVEAYETEEHPREVTSVVSRSGNTTIWLRFHPNEVDPAEGFATVIQELTSDMDEVGRELAQDGFFALNVVEDSEMHAQLLTRLDLWAANGRLGYLTNDGIAVGFENLEG
jgi:Domain of unknown function (DUF4265)